MKPHMLVTSFKLRISRAEYEPLCQEVAAQIASVPGLLWKAWIFHDGRNEAGGVYLFQSEAALEAFVSGPIISQLENHPAFEAVRIKTFDVMEEPSALTHFDVSGQAVCLG